MHFCPGMDEIAEDHRIRIEMQIFPGALKCRKMDHGIGILVSVKSYGLIVKSRRKGSVIDRNKRTFYIPVFNIQPKMDQRCGNIGIQYCQVTAGSRPLVRSSTSYGSSGA